MRGAQWRLRELPVEIGIIPADAGSTRFPLAKNRVYRDHPRGCGEHQAQTIYAKAQAGSSPRMRGAPPLFDCYCGTVGIIPADAGSTPIL